MEWEEILVWEEILEWEAINLVNKPGIKIPSINKELHGAQEVISKCLNGEINSMFMSHPFNSLEDAKSVSELVPSTDMVQVCPAEHAIEKEVFAPNALEEELTTSMVNLAANVKEEDGKNVMGIAALAVAQAIAHLEVTEAMEAIVAIIAAMVALVIKEVLETKVDSEIKVALGNKEVSDNRANGDRNPNINLSNSLHNKISNNIKN